MKYILVLLLAVLTGCVNTQPAQLNMPVTNSPVVLKDHRDKSQTTTEFLSLMVTNCDYGIRRLGDEFSTPNKAVYLKNMVASQYPSVKSIEVNDFVTYVNMQHSLREGNIFRGPAMEIFECNENTDKFTRYTLEENPNNEMILIGTLNVTIDGETIERRATSILKCPDSTECHAQNEAMKKVLKELADQLLATKNS
jgi:hypothetical protein